MIAEQGGQLVGWLSGYRPPSAPENFFVWQMAVSAQARGQDLAARMIEAMLARTENAGVSYLTTTVTEDNRASWAVFDGLSRQWGVPLQKSIRFDRETHFGGAHATEWQARIGPLRARGMPIEENLTI